MIPIKFPWLQQPRLVLLFFATALSQFLATLPVHAAEPATPKVDFSRQIRPILSSKCFKCHGPDETQRKADLRLDEAERARAKSIVPGNPDKSLLVQRIKSDDPEMRMPPPDSKLILTKVEISLLQQWVAQGADYSVHWAFQAEASVEALQSRPGRRRIEERGRGSGRRKSLSCRIGLDGIRLLGLATRPTRLA